MLLYYILYIYSSTHLCFISACTISGDNPSMIVIHGCRIRSLNDIRRLGSNTNILLNKSLSSGEIISFRDCHSDQNSSLGRAGPLIPPVIPLPLNSSSLEI